MSFYGNVFYELTNAFSSIIVKNSGKSSKSFITANSNPVEVTSVGLGGKFNLDTGNKWIQMKGNFDDKSCKIYHAKSDSSDTSHSAAAFTALEESNDAATELTPGGYFKTTTFNYDDAGHVTSVSPTYYRLPLSETEKDLESLKERMDNIEDSDEEQNNQLTGFTESLGETNTAVDNATNRVSTLESTVGNKFDFTFQEGKTICSAIGSMALLESQYGNSVTISSILSDLISGLGDNRTQNEVNLAATQRAIENLCKELAKANIINIDSTSLWKANDVQ